MSNSTHTYDTAKALTANAFTRDKYLFKGWATSAGGSVVYSNGQSVKNLTSAAGGTVNLYAVWEYQYAKPSFSGLSAWRTSNTASGGTYPKQDDGTNADISIRVNPGQKKTTAGGSFSNVSTTVKFFYKLHTDSSYTQFGSAQTISAATTLTAHISATLDITKQYDIKVEASVIESGTTKESASLTTFISTATFLVDMSENGIAFGKVSQKAAFECNMHMYLDGNNPESRIYSYNHRKKTDYSGGWAYHPLTCLDDAGSDYAHFGVYGSANNLNYLYLGSNSYDGNNLRVFSDGHIWANTIEIQKVTVGSNTFADANPKLIFKNVDGSQSGSLTWTDYDSVQSPASLTLNGNQGGEYFIAPNIKATSNIYVGNTAVSLSGHTHSYLPLSGGTLTGLLRITTSGKTSTFGAQNSDFCHIYTDAAQFALNKSIAMVGNGTIGTAGYPTGQINVKHGSSILLSTGNSTGSCSLYAGNYNDTRNIYYAVSRSDSYHSFYVGGDGIVYIYSDQVAFKKKVNVTGVITGSSTVYSGGNTMCSSDNAQYCGNSSHRWKAVYATNSSIQTSDRKDKDVLGNIDFAKDLIMSLEPIQYMWKAGDHRRKRMGFVAQDVAEICNTLGENLSLVTASFGDEGEEGERLYLGEKVDDALLKWGMSYEQLIAPLVQVVQEQQREIDELKRRVS